MQFISLALISLNIFSVDSAVPVGTSVRVMHGTDVNFVLFGLPFVSAETLGPMVGFLMNQNVHPATVDVRAQLSMADMSRFGVFSIDCFGNDILFARGRIEGIHSPTFCRILMNIKQTITEFCPAQGIPLDGSFVYVLGEYKFEFFTNMNNGDDELIASLSRLMM